MRWAARCAALAATIALAGCVAPPATDPQTPSPDARAAKLRPLAPQLHVPPGATPRSAVASVRYDLAVSGIEERPSADEVGEGEAPLEIFERGGASWYGIQFHDKKTANGERFDMEAMTAAHKTLPFGSQVCVRSLVNGRQVQVRINDRGPFKAGRVIDLSRAAADELGMTGLGIQQVALSVLEDTSQSCGQAAPAQAAAVVDPVEARRQPPDAPADVAARAERSKASATGRSPAPRTVRGKQRRRR